jgi:pimeloyl-ACP methyl ester carboxylesterase
MNNKKDLFLITSIIIIVSLSLTPILRSQVNVASAQSPICDNGVVMPASPSHAIPVILIHGYLENSRIWSYWESALSQNNIPYCTVSFQSSDNILYNYDACGSAVDHARDLAQIVQQVKQATGQDKVNIVAHSKGGLDARVYLANTNTADVKNLIMIGTPNAGDLFADSIVLYNPLLMFSPPNPYYCTPALFDLETNAHDISANQNIHTKYYDIAGGCLSWPVPNDGLVTVESVESLQYSTHLPPTEDCHQYLLGNTEYGLAQHILQGQ